MGKERVGNRGARGWKERREGVGREGCDGKGGMGKARDGGGSGRGEGKEREGT